MFIPSIKKASVFAAFSLLLAATLSSSTSAHVVVKPSEVVSAGFETFTIGVPNEKDISTTSIRLVIPKDLKYVQPTQKAGWQIEIEKEGSGEAAVVTAITWTGDVQPGFRDDLTFSAQVPATVSELKWKAYQTYSDGTTVSWDKAATGDSHESKDKDSGPYSVTKVIADATSTKAAKNSDQTATDAKSAADMAFYVGAAGIVVGLIGVYFGTRRH